MALNKIIYFDKETIRNILQEKNKGVQSTQTDISSTSSISGSLSTETSSKVKMEVPFLARLSFLFTGSIAASYALTRDKTTTITSTEISDFERIEKEFEKFEKVQVSDIENSSTSLRVAGSYLRMMKGGVADVDVKEFRAVMDSYEGYDTYKLDEETYIRFNNSAFISNYKRNDLLNATLTIYCIFVGEFERERFDFIKQIEKMQTLFSVTDSPKTLSDLFPAEQAVMEAKEKDVAQEAKSKSDIVKLYDAVYACIDTEKMR